ncbi:HU family DNA-binding protein [Desulfovibrio sp. OttesenSCG-928-G15]|nr:HU family DNA-binding protein [Desulfovibrio sp. OttesenSCG-928-G15]
MVKADLVDAIAKQAGLTKVAAEKALNASLDSIKEVLLTEGKLTLTGFGTFAAETRQARKGRNPRTGQAINIPAAKVVKFRPGKKLKDTIR